MYNFGRWYRAKNLDNNQIEGNPEHMNVTTKKWIYKRTT